MASTTSTPSKRAGGGARAARGNAMLSDTMNGDMEFLTDYLRQKPQLLMSVATLVRSGNLEKAIDEFFSGGSKRGSVSGGAIVLPPSAKKVRDLRYKYAIEILKGFSNHMTEQAAIIEASADKDKQQLVTCLLNFGAGTMPQQDLPTAWEGWRDITTLQAMFRHRYEAKGARLQGYSADHPWDFGFFKQCTGQGKKKDSARPEQGNRNEETTELNTLLTVLKSI